MCWLLVGRVCFRLFLGSVVYVGCCLCVFACVLLVCVILLLLLRVCCAGMSDLAGNDCFCVFYVGAKLLFVCFCVWLWLRVSVCCPTLF